jgi:hypothetical protein
VAAVALWAWSVSLHAQSTSATLAGDVVDSSGAVIAGAEVIVALPSAGQRRSVTTTGDGRFAVAGLEPGVYDIEAVAPGFARTRLEKVIVNVSDRRQLRIRLEIAGAVEQVQVTAGARTIADSPILATVVDRELLDRVPLNGRSVQTLIGLTPGVVFTPAAVLEQGQFSVNGQRANANYFTVDGVSANFGISPTTELGQTGSGALPALGTTGGTNTLVSVDAIEEFKVLTSPFAPEFGRQTGGQIAVLTRAGSNAWHGSALWSFRDDALDANDWFANRAGIEKPELRQHDVAGTLGGPLVRNRTFVFFSHETLRVRAPRVVNLAVPSMATRSAAPVALQPYLNAYPLPTGPDLVGGFAALSAGYSERTDLDATSVRLDHAWSDRWRTFGRYNRAPSSALQRATNQNSANVLTRTSMTTDTVTAGLTGTVRTNVLHELRGNYSRAQAQAASEMDDFGGARPLSDSAMFPSFTSRDDALFQFIVTGGTNLFAGRETHNVQQQINLTDNVSVTLGRHELKFGVDYRALFPTVEARTYQQTVQFTSLGGTTGGVLTGRPAAVQINAGQHTSLKYSNGSAYMQDTWHPTSRLTLTYGMRWEHNPPPTGRDGTALATFRDAAGGYEDLASIAIVSDTPLFETTWGNVAPRVGAAYQLSQARGRETVVRGGYGLFYDLGTGAYNPTLSPPSPSVILRPAQYPLADAALAPPVATLSPPYGNITAADPELQLPRVHQFSATLEQSIATAHVMSISYVGAVGRELLRTERLRNPRPDITNLRIVTNTSASDYHALQAQFSRRLTRGLQALASYTWAHSTDTLSSDFFSSPATTVLDLDPQQDRGPSDFDVRHAFAAAATYSPQIDAGQPLLNALLEGWSIDGILRLQSASPVTVFSARNVGFGAFAFRPDLVAGVPMYLEGSSYPGGQALNRAAFAVPVDARQGTLGRNTLRGFPLKQVDLAIRRRIPATRQVRVTLGVEIFNLFNTPAFAPPVSDLSSPFFGQSTQTLGRSLGTGGPGGGLSPLYQIGGPRSMQLDVKVQF